MSNRSLLKDVPNKVAPGYMDAAFGRADWPTDDASLGYLRTAHKGLREAWVAIHDQHARRMRDESMLPAARLMSSAEYAEKKAAEAERSFESAALHAKNRIAELSRELGSKCAPPPESGAASVGAEIRAHFRTLTAEQRGPKIEAAINKGDVTTLRALVSAPAYLSGMADGAHERARAAFLEQVAPGQLPMLRTLESALQTTSSAHAELLAHVTAEIDFASAEAFKRTKA